MVTTFGRATLSWPITISNYSRNCPNNLLKFFSNPLSSYLSCNNLLLNCLSCSSNIISCFSYDSSFNNSNLRGSNLINNNNTFYGSSNIITSKRSRGILILLQHKQTKQQHEKLLITIQESKCLNEYRNHKGIADSAFIPSFSLPQRIEYVNS
jgi:hypothetical protein